MKQILFSCLIILFSVPANSTDYYKCKKPNGQILYTDRHCFAAMLGSYEKTNPESTVWQDNPEFAANTDKQPSKSVDKNGLLEIVGNIDAEMAEFSIIDKPDQPIHQGILDKILLFLSPSTKHMENNSIPTSAYTCQGKTLCKQMTSCEEAMFYLQHCPNVKIDGNNDGIPCEQQWCN